VGGSEAKLTCARAVCYAQGEFYKKSRPGAKIVSCLLEVSVRGFRKDFERRVRGY
jgi:hypothetical protein